MNSSEGSAAAGIVSVSWAPMRREPRHAAEMVSQALLGEILRIESETAGSGSQWVSVRTPDGYAGFVTAGSFRRCSDDEAADWMARADGFSVGTALQRPGDSADAVPNHAPWGSRLQVDGDSVVLPGGERVFPARASAIRHGAEVSVIESALSWLGTPYLWGGRTEQGADCSGFVQAVCALHRISLKRDSRDQFDAGEVITGTAAPGDLLFFAWDDKPVSHVGLGLGEGRMIHASETRGCVAIDVLGDGAFGRRLAAGLVGIVRPRG